MNRRSFVASASLASLGLATKSLLPTFIPAAAQPSMPGQGFRSALAGCPILLGCALNLDLLKTNPALGQAVAQDMRLITPEGAMKWGSLRPSPDVFNFGQADAYFRFAKANGLRVRGHNLCWNDNSQPKWFNTYLNASNAKSMLLQHINTVVGRYRGQVQSWDVVNEAIIAADGRPDLLSTHPWTELIGPEYIDLAFHAAADTDPGTPLVMNEVNMESNDARGATNRAALLNLVRGLKKRGVPISAIGLESHIHVETPVGGDDFRRFILELNQLGLDIYITELDINDVRTQGTAQQRDKAVADQYSRYLEAVLTLVQPKVIAFWSYKNGDNWLDGMMATNPNARRADNTPHRPGLVGFNLGPTPAHAAVVSTLRQYCH